MFRFQEVFWDIMKALLYMIIREAKRNCHPDVVTPPSRHIHSGGGQTLRASQSYSLKPAFARGSYRRGVRCPGQEDPFVALVVRGVQPVQNVGGDLVVEQGLYQRIKLLVPLLGGPPGGAHGQLFWKAYVRHTNFSSA